MTAALVVPVKNTKSVVERPELPKLEKIDIAGYSLDLDYYLTKDYEDISSASTEIPAVIEWLNTQLQYMIEQKMKLDDEVKEFEASAYFNLQNGLWEDMHYVGKKTSYALSLAMRLDPKVKKSKQDLALYTGWVTRIQNLIYSFQAKLDLVRTAEATRRALLSSVPAQHEH